MYLIVATDGSKGGENINNNLIETRKNETMTLDTHRTDTGCIHQDVWTHRKI